MPKTFESVESATEATNLAEALWLYQQDPPVLVKDKAGQAGNQPTRYADLAQANDKILTRLNALGVTYSCEPTTVQLGSDANGPIHRFVLHWILEHVPSGDRREGFWPIPPNDNPQRMGSWLSYARRYILINLVNAATEDEDDDGYSAGGRPTAQRRASGSRARPRADRVADDPNPPEPGAERPREANTRRRATPTEDMQTKLATQFGLLGIKSRDDRLGRMSQYFGRPITSIKDLTFQEGKDLIDTLERRLAAQAANPVPEADNREGLNERDAE